ncbi:Flp family type IVb pilin [Neobacillus niacini]|uniref:Flp family type IVb pilin n=1 Tax=Neobacillus niacini TaxID=86668 RepID=UPI000B26AF56|nr:Flp family type IVb pilin [Neobacillus niacini]MEC1523503.1 Flp family type IVb pilin [Neobacillus niacini]
MNMLKRLWKEEDGQGLTEYGLIVGLVAVMGAGITLLFGDEINKLFTRVGQKIAALL